jgi:hypothetical protein
VAIEWSNLSSVGGTDFDLKCGWCGREVAASRAFVGRYESYPGDRDGFEVYIAICPRCTMPTTMIGKHHRPAPRFGNEVEHVPESVYTLYNEARDAYSVEAFTSAVLACRKLLMNLAVDKGAAEGKGFLEYVDYLEGQNWVPPGGKAWVDRIRKTGNEATHEIDLKTREDAELLISFVEMLLKFVYEFPAKAQP